MVNAELREEFSNNPFAQPGIQFWYAQDVYPDYVVVKDTESGSFYKIPYTLSADEDDIELGDPVEVEQTYTPMAASDASQFGGPGSGPQGGKSEPKDEFERMDRALEGAKLHPSNREYLRDAAKDAGSESEAKSIQSSIKDAADHYAATGKAHPEYRASKYGSDNILDLGAYGHTFSEGVEVETNPKFCLFNELPQDFTEAPARMPLLPKPGTYTHEKYGKVVITKERNQRFTDNVNNAIYQSNLPIDAEHELDLSGAFGYIKKASMNVDGSVDATDLEWTDRGKQAFDDNRFKYFSPKWWDKWTDPMTEQSFKDVVIGGALTTRPFFKEKALKPLIASERGIFLQDGDSQQDGNTVILQFTALVPETQESNDMATKEQIETARRLVAAADAKAMKEFVEGKSPDEIASARALVASEDARIAAEKSAKDPDGDGDDDTNAAGDKDNSHFDTKGNKKPEMFDSDGKPMAKAASEITVPQVFAERLTAAEAEAKRFKEELDSTKAEAKKANDRADAMDKANRIMRFTTMTKDWPGDREKNVNLLEHFATTCDGGEESKEFKDYVGIQSASSTQLHEAGLFSEFGSSLGGSPDSPLGELEVKASEILAANSGKMTKAQAFSEACNQNPKLYDAHRAAERRLTN